MTCPRCGVMNPSDRAKCSRCSGSLAPPPVRDDRPLPSVLPITRRAELMSGRAGAVRQGGPGDAMRPPLPNQMGGGHGAKPGGDDPVGGDLYLLAMERSTGQPPPPEGTAGPTESVRSDRPARIAIGLSGA